MAETKAAIEPMSLLTPLFPGLEASHLENGGARA